MLSPPEPVQIGKDQSDCGKKTLMTIPEAQVHKNQCRHKPSPLTKSPPCDVWPSEKKLDMSHISTIDDGGRNKLNKIDIKFLLSQTDRLKKVINDNNT